MPFTQLEIDSLRAAIATGVKSVAYSDRNVTYHSLDDMLKALAIMEGELAVEEGNDLGGTRTTLASFSRE